MRTLLVIALATTAFSSAAIAQDIAPDNGFHRTISVNGTASVSLAPDEAMLRSGIMTIAEEARQALTANNIAMNNVIETFKSAGVEAIDISTSGFSIHPQHRYNPENIDEATITSYVVNNNVLVRVRDLDILGDVLDAVVSSGSNRIDSLRFIVSDQSAATDKARELAMEDARRKADILARSSGLRLGNPITITEGSHVQPPMPYMMARAEMGTMDSSVPVETGSQEINVTVSVTWEAFGE